MAEVLNGFDYESIHKQAGYVIKHRKRMKPEVLEKYKQYFETHCATSKKQVKQAAEAIPHGIQHNLANNYPFALSIVKAVDAFLYDVDGNRYYDMLQAGGPTILGSNYPLVRDKVLELIRECGPVFGMYSNYEYELASRIKKHFPTVERFRMMGSGTEADIIALRLARAYTGKKYIIRIQNNYHGWSDQVIYNNNEIKTPDSLHHGIPTECFQYTTAVPTNDLKALEQAFAEQEEKGGTAAFFVEAIGRDSGALPLTREYQIGAEKLCRKYNALLVYDEVVTAFRLGMNGAQGFYGTKPDITVFGKIIAGGFPSAGGVGGRAEIIDMLAAGQGTDQTKAVRVGGTLTANPVSCLAGATVIDELVRTDAHRKLEAGGEYLCGRIAELTRKYQIPALVFHQGSIMHIDITGIQHVPTFYEDPNSQACKDAVNEATRATTEFTMALAAEGVIVPSGNKAYLSLATLPYLDDIAAAYERVFQKYT